MRAKSHQTGTTSSSRYDWVQGLGPGHTSGRLPPARSSSCVITLLQLLGEGSFAQVWRAQDQIAKRKMAVKMYKLRSLQQPHVRMLVAQEIGYVCPALPCPAVPLRIARFTLPSLGV